MAIVGAYDGTLHALSLRDGTRRWSHESEAQIHATCAIQDGLAYVAGCDGHFRGLDVATGVVKIDVRFGGYTAASPAILSGIAVFGTFNNEVVGIDLAQKAVIWRYVPKKQFPFYSSAAISEGLVFVGSRDKALHVLDLKTGELRQYTDVLGGNWSASVLNDGDAKRIAFISYYKGEYSVRTIERKEPLHTASSADFGGPGAIIDFQAPIQHTVIADNQRKKKPFEKMFLEGRPPVNVGVTSNGDIFGGSQISFGDVTGDQQFSVYAASISQYRTFAGSYVNLSRRLQWALTAENSTQFYYAQTGSVFYDPAYSSIISRDDAVATRTVRGASAIGSYPISRYRRVEVSAGLLQLREQYANPDLQAYTEAYQESVTGSTQSIFRNGTLLPLSVAYVSETTVFREFGPLSGSTMRLGYDIAPGFGGMLSRQTFDAEARYYQRLASTGVLALRLRGFKSIGDFPDYTYFGGNADMRGYDYLQFIGQNAVFANAELRFPLVTAALTPIGVLGGIRGVFFANVGGGWFNDQGYKFATSDPEVFTPQTGNQIDPSTGAILFDPTTGLPVVVEGTPTTINGFRLRDGRASYGMGLETFAFGFPIHFDWAWRTTFNKKWENALFASDGGSSNFRKARFSVWIGYDF